MNWANRFMDQQRALDEHEPLGFDPQAGSVQQRKRIARVAEYAPGSLVTS